MVWLQDRKERRLQCIPCDSVHTKDSHMPDQQQCIQVSTAAYSAHLCVHIAAGIIHAELFEQLQMAKQKGMSFKAVAEARNESAVLALTRAANFYYLVAEQRVLEARKQLGNTIRRQALQDELEKLHPGMSVHRAVALVLKPPEFFTATEVGT